MNAEKIAVTGKKLDEKIYYRHSGYPGGLKERTLRVQLERQPAEVIRKAVKGMLPRNRLARQQLTNSRSTRARSIRTRRRLRSPSRCKWQSKPNISAPASARPRSRA